MSQDQLDPVLVGRVIARLRTEKGLTQEVLSGLSDIGRTHLSAIERGERKPTLETLYRISNALDLPMSAVTAEIEKAIGGEGTAETVKTKTLRTVSLSGGFVFRHSTGRPVRYRRRRSKAWFAARSRIRRRWRRPSSKWRQ